MCLLTAITTLWFKPWLHDLSVSVTDAAQPVLTDLIHWSSALFAVAKQASGSCVAVLLRGCVAV